MGYWYKENIFIYPIKEILSKPIFFRFIKKIYLILEFHLRTKSGYKKSFKRLTAKFNESNSASSLNSEFGY